MSHGAKFETDVKDTVEELKKLGYKVDLQRIHDWYQSNGETWPQYGYSIQVLPYVDQEKPDKTCHYQGCRNQVPHSYKGDCPVCGAPAEYIYV